MSIFLGVHKIPEDEVVEEEIKASWEKYKTAARAKGLKPLHVNISADKGLAYCETEASSAEEVLAAHKDADLVTEDVIQVQQLD